MRRPLMIASVGLAVVSAVLVAGFFTVYVERPTVLRVAVPSTDTDNYDLMAAASRLLKHGHTGVRLRLVNPEGAATPGSMLDTGAADLAVVRTDLGMPADGATVVLLHKEVGLLAAPGGSEVDKLGDLAGKTVGVVSQHAGDDKLLATALAQYDLAPDAVKTVPLRPDEVTRALKDKTVDAVFGVGQVSTGTVPAMVKAVAAAGEGPPVFLPVSEADAIAQRAPAYESIEVVRGAFGGTPPRPADAFDTLGVTYRLVANETLEQGPVAALTRFLLSERVALAALAPVARRIEAPSTDKGAALPVHAGTAAYLDDDEETFLDRYSDFIYIGAMVLGVVASGATALYSRIGASGGPQAEEVLGQLLAIFKGARGATSLPALDAYEDEVDGIVAAALEGGCLRSFDERRVAMLNLAVDQARAGIRDRRDALRRGTARAPDEQTTIEATPAPPALTVVSSGAATR